MCEHRRVGFTLVESLVTAGIVGMTLMLFLPVILRSIHQTRARGCATKMERIGRGFLAYEAAHGRFPRGREYPDLVLNDNPINAYSNYSGINFQNIDAYETGFLSAFTQVLSFIDREDVAALIVSPTPKQMTVGGEPINPNLPAAFAAGNQFICPEDNNTTPGGVAETNYRVNFGGSTPYGGAQSTNNQTQISLYLVDPSVGRSYSSRGNGAFTIGDGLTAAKFLDGLGKTAFLSERTKGSGNIADVPPTLADVISVDDRFNGLLTPTELLSRCESTDDSVVDVFMFSAAGRWLPMSSWANGWLFAGYDATQYNHLTPPNWNHVDCAGWSSISDTPGEHSIMSARSMHPTSVNVFFGDGRVEQIANTIDVQAWREMGARDDVTQRRARRNNVESDP